MAERKKHKKHKGVESSSVDISPRDILSISEIPPRKIGADASDVDAGVMPVVVDPVVIDPVPQSVSEQTMPVAPVRYRIVVKQKSGGSAKRTCMICVENPKLSRVVDLYKKMVPAYVSPSDDEKLLFMGPCDKEMVESVVKPLLSMDQYEVQTDEAFQNWDEAEVAAAEEVVHGLDILTNSHNPGERREIGNSLRLALKNTKLEFMLPAATASSGGGGGVTYNAKVYGRKK